MRKKNTIRLNESQLHNMISESVKQVLSELDWKTYASAADKERDKQLYDTRIIKRLDAFNDAASKALSKKYNKKLETTSQTWNPKYRFVKSLDDYWALGSDPTGPDDDYIENERHPNPIYKRIGREVNDFNHDKHEYIKGKGWQLKK